MKIVNPATDQLIVDYPTDSAATVQDKLEKLRAGQEAWARTFIDDRLRVIGKFGELVDQNKDELASVLTSETGKPITQSYNEIKGSLNRVTHLQRNAAKWLKPEELGFSGNTLELIRHEPLGVIANISAWNYPYNVGFNVFLYALAAGNAVMYKPSEYATLTGLKFQDMLIAAGAPEDVFQLVIGDGKVGQYMLDSDLDGYFFTGSYKTGVHIAKSVAHKLVPVQLELGGKDPLYVMDDVADVKQAAISAAEGAFYNNGQSCCAVERLYVHEKIYDDFVRYFVEEVSHYKIGDPMNPDTFIGPLTREAQVQTILDQIRNAQAFGAELMLGGSKIDRPGNYLYPTILTNVDAGMSVMKDESFGPVIGIQKVKNDDEALALMKDTSYGLTAAVYSSSEKRAKQILDQLNVGTAYWNCCDRVSPNVPWSGRKNSGLGATLSYLGIRAFTQPKAYHLRG